jgi:hypothetical protein
MNDPNTTTAALYDIGQRVRIVGLDRYEYIIGSRRQIMRTRSQMPEYLLIDAHGQRCGWQYADRLIVAGAE